MSSVYWELPDGTTEIIDGRDELPFTPIPNYIYDLWYPILGAVRQGVYDPLVRLAGNRTARISIREMAKHAQLGTERYSRTLQELQMLGFIEVKTPNEDERRRGKLTQIKVLTPPSRITPRMIEKIKAAGIVKPSFDYKILAPWLLDKYAPSKQAEMKQYRSSIFDEEDLLPPDDQSSCRDDQSLGSDKVILGSDKVIPGSDKVILGSDFTEDSTEDSSEEKKGSPLSARNNAAADRLRQIEERRRSVYGKGTGTGEERGAKGGGFVSNHDLDSHGCSVGKVVLGILDDAGKKKNNGLSHKQVLDLKTPIRLKDGTTTHSPQEFFEQYPREYANWCRTVSEVLKRRNLQVTPTSVIKFMRGIDHRGVGFYDHMQRQGKSLPIPTPEQEQRAAQGDTVAYPEYQPDAIPYGEAGEFLKKSIMEWKQRWEQNGG